MTGATIGPDAGMDGAGLLPAGAGAVGGCKGAAPAGGCWLLHPAKPQTPSRLHSGSRQFRSGVRAFMLTLGQARSK